MTTITALQLRKNMDTYAKRAAQGEHIRVTYRGKLSFTLGPDTKESQSNVPAILAAARAFHAKVPDSVKNYQPTVEEDKAILDAALYEKYGL